jgi:glycosyltransferase involved in cell wall biosynthesis
VVQEHTRRHGQSSHLWPDYVLITAARNEQAHLRATVDAVSRQTVRPLRWVICVNDSTDRTLELARQHSLSAPYVVPLNVCLGGPRSFGNKALAVARAFAEIEHLSFAFVGILDADHSFGPRYYEVLLSKFLEFPDLGIATGTHIEVLSDGTSRVLRQPHNIAVCGMQMFRRECFSDIGGFRTLKWGGIDTLAGVMARQRGWTTQTFDEVEYHHLRQMGTEGVSTVLLTRIRYGIRDEKLGMHPAYVMLKFLKWLGERPYVLGSFAWLAGFLCALFLPRDDNVPSSCQSLLREEQLRRLHTVFQEMNREGFLQCRS